MQADYPHAAEAIGTVSQVYDGALTPDLAVATFRNIDRLFPTRAVAAGPSRPLPRAAQQLQRLQFTAEGRDYDLYDVLALNRVTGLLILKDGQIVHESYQHGNTEQTRWMSMSVAKSVTSTLIGAAVQDGHIASLHDPVVRYVPRLADSAYDGASVRDVLMMCSGVQWNETYTDPLSDRRRLLQAQIAQQSGTAMDLMAQLPRAAAPGTVHTYSTGETQVAGEIVFGATGIPLADYLSHKIWQPCGMEAEARWWLDAPDGLEIGGSGICATLRDYGRFGLFIQNNGVANGRHVLPAGWVAQAGAPQQLRTGAPLNYGYLWWTAGGQSAADGAFQAQGIHGQYLYVNQKERVVIVNWGAQSKPMGLVMVPMAAFFDAVVAALKPAA